MHIRFKAACCEEEEEEEEQVNTLGFLGFVFDTELNEHVNKRKGLNEDPDTGEE